MAIGYFVTPRLGKMLSEEEPLECRKKGELYRKRGARGRILQRSKWPLKLRKLIFCESKIEKKCLDLNALPRATYVAREEIIQIYSCARSAHALPFSLANINLLKRRL